LAVVTATSLESLDGRFRSFLRHGYTEIRKAARAFAVTPDGYRLEINGVSSW
jgi:hypothetical protein